MAVGQKNGQNFGYFKNETQNKYIDILNQEIDFTLNQYFKIINNQKINLKTLYFGGGTPSLISPENLNKIIRTINKYYNNKQENYEISIEADPGTFDKNTIESYSDLGINRLSIGIQSFIDEDLKRMNRSHNLEQIYESLDILKSVKKFENFENLSFDLIMNIPYQTLQQWEYNLQQLNIYKPGHASLYSLSLEEDSYYYKKLKYRENMTPLPNEPQACETFKQTQQFMEEYGYIQYEISSYYRILPNKNTQSQHNNMYWQGDKQFFGFGMGATSLLNELRFQRPNSLKKYYEFVQNLTEKNNIKTDVFLNCGERESGIQKLECILMGKLRTLQGVNVEELKIKFGMEIVQKIIQNKNDLQKKSEVKYFKNTDENFIVIDLKFGGLLVDQIVEFLLQDI